MAIKIHTRAHPDTVERDKHLSSVSKQEDAFPLRMPLCWSAARSLRPL